MCDKEINFNISHLTNVQENRLLVFYFVTQNGCFISRGVS